MKDTLKLAPVCATLVIVCVCLTEAGPTRKCDTDQYYQSVLEQCEPCKKICDPLNRTDCVKRCSEYIQSLTCAGDEFWDSILQTCMPCQSICDPLNRTVCQQKCLENIQRAALDSEMSTVDPIPQENVEIPEVYSNSEYTDVIIVVTLVTVVITAVITSTVCFLKKKGICCRRVCCFEPKTKPIQVTDAETTVSLFDVTVGGNTQPSSLESN